MKPGDFYALDPDCIFDKKAVQTIDAAKSRAILDCEKSKQTRIVIKIVGIVEPKVTSEWKSS